MFVEWLVIQEWECGAVEKAVLDKIHVELSIFSAPAPRNSDPLNFV